MKGSVNVCPLVVPSPTPHTAAPVGKHCGIDLPATRRRWLVDKSEFARAWPTIRAQVKARWNKLTDQDLDGVQSNPELLIEMIQEKYEESRQAVELQLKSLVEHRAGVR
jgi:hypothetical protein